MDEQGTSVKCQIDGCFAQVHGDVRCRAHGGDPFYEWTTSIFGLTEWSAAADVRATPVQVAEGASNA